eukprot:5225053-Prymnesium_polylepis.1
MAVSVHRSTVGLSRREYPVPFTDSDGLSNTEPLGPLPAPGAFAKGAVASATCTTASVSDATASTSGAGDASEACISAGPAPAASPGRGSSGSSSEDVSLISKRAADPSASSPRPSDSRCSLFARIVLLALELVRRELVARRGASGRAGR